MKLRRFANCTRNLTWETELPSLDDVPRVMHALQAHGAAITTPLPRLQKAELRGHQVVAVGRRVQIRVAYTVPSHDRRRAAEEVLLVLVRALQSSLHG